MTARSIVPISVALLGAVLLAGCATKGVPLGGHYDIEKSFRRMVTEDRFGVRVVNKLESGTMSEDELKALSKFIAITLRETLPSSVVLDITPEPDYVGALDLVLQVDVTTFAPADADQRSQGIRSQLAGRLTMLDTTNANRGTALVRADGFRLDVLKEVKPPDTVVYFCDVIVDLVQ